MHIVLQIVLLALFIFASLAYGAVHYWAYSIVFGLTFLLCALVFLQAGISLLRKDRLQRLGGVATAWALTGPYLFFLGAFMLYVLFQLAPLPDGILKTLSPYTGYLYEQAHVLTAPAGAFSGSDLTGYLSLDRDKTVKSLLAFAAYLGFGFLLARTIRSSGDVKRFALVLVIFVAGFSVYGLLSVLQASPKLAGWKNPLLQGARVSATLVNPDHFAAYLVTGVYVTLGYLAALLVKRPPAVGRTRWRRWLSLIDADGAYVPKAFLLLFAIGVMIVVLFYTLSRGGVLGLAVSLLFCLFLLFLKTRRPIFLLLILLPVGFIVYYAQVLGVEPLMDRFEQTRKEMLEWDENVRTQSYLVALDLWHRFLWFGSGLGSFEVVFPGAASLVYEGYYVPYLHNDWLQLAVETGWIGSVLFLSAVVALLVRILHRWWRVQDRWGFGFGLAAMSAMIGSGVHAVVDFGLRVPVNSMFLVLLVSLALAVLTEGSGRTKEAGGKGPPGRQAPWKRGTAGVILLTAAALCLWSSALVGSYGLAQHYSPTEIDSVERRDYAASTAKLQNALRLNPLNGDYWMNLAIVAEPVDADPDDRTDDAQSVLPDQGAVDPEAIPGVEKWNLRRVSLQDWLFARAIACSPAAAEYWLAWSDHLWGGLRGEEGGEKIIAKGEENEERRIDLTARGFRMALELHPNSKLVRQQAAKFFEQFKQKSLPEH